MKEQLVKLIVERLHACKESAKAQFFLTHSIKVARHFTVDNLLPIAITEQIYTDFPRPHQMRLLSSYGRIKLKYSPLKDTASLIQDINYAIQDPRVVAVIEEITDIPKQIPDPSRFAGGASTLLKGYYINPHLDNSHDIGEKLFYRTVNMLFYVSPNWKLENGGNYELWDRKVENRIILPCFFNRLVVMETNSTSWHAVNPVLCDQPRCCIFNYYFSELSPEGREYFFNKPSFQARPEQKILRKITTIKNKLLLR